jgi:hypothetical protein
VESSNLKVFDVAEELILFLILIEVYRYARVPKIVIGWISQPSSKELFLSTLGINIPRKNYSN